MRSPPDRFTDACMSSPALHTCRYRTLAVSALKDSDGSEARFICHRRDVLSKRDSNAALSRAVRRPTSPTWA